MALNAPRAGGRSPHECGNGQRRLTGCESSTSEMRKPCECCHTKMKFIWQMNGNFKHSMVIPDRFLSHFAAKSSGTITLETPNGNMYKVGVGKNMKRTLLLSGWEAFVHANSIQENDFLSFRYRGSSRFAVTVFDASGLEKVYFCCAAAGMKNASNNVQKKARTYIDILSSSDDHTTQSSASDTSDECQKARPNHHGKQAKKPSVSSSEDLSEDGSSGHRSLESEDLGRFSSPYYLPGHHKLAKEQKAELVALVDKIQPEICVLVIIMNKTNVKRHPDLVVPKDALLHFPHKNQIITLELPGKRKNWACKFRIRADGGGRHLYLGDFVHDNRILEGDLCILQPMTKNDASVFTMTVHLIRKERTDITSSHQTRKINSGGISSSSHHDTTRYNQGDKRFEERFARRDSSSHFRKITKMAYEESGEGSPDENDSFKSDDLQTLTITDYVLSYKSYLSRAQTGQVIMLLGEIRPKKPVLVAVMRKKNVQSSSPFLEIPKEYAAAHFPNESVAITLQMLGKNKKWHPRLCMENDKRIYMLRGHWLDFVLDNHVMEGDICLFEPMKGGKFLCSQFTSFAPRQLIARVELVFKGLAQVMEEPIQRWHQVFILRKNQLMEEMVVRKTRSMELQMNHCIIGSPMILPTFYRIGAIYLHSRRRLF
ncbi:B3 domain-containing protein Os03g0619600-like isoform X2 [Oryza glaberrima]|uniref:B3 domain-containing protein Os03g0619600-like isoform X2 n=1 Tax=Oryza glaberrima TaxID=4538 RepID=UPI00224C5539|nr:B3 domain-containing protein Os03g0619600-like isoform X2 [Oryza glaberrima]